MMKELEKYISEMDYRVENKKEFLESFKTACPAHMKNIWKHLFRHVRPKDETLIVRKQCFLYSLKKRIDGPKSFEYLSDSSLERCRLKYDLACHMKCYDLLRRNLEERLKATEASHVQRVEEEVITMELINKSHLLKKKKEQVESDINDLQKLTKKMKIMKTPFQSLISYGHELTDWERRLLLLSGDARLDAEILGLKSSLLELLKTEIPRTSFINPFNSLTLSEEFLLKRRKLLFEIKLSEAEVAKETSAIKETIMKSRLELPLEIFDDFLHYLNDKMEMVLSDVVFDENQAKPVLMDFELRKLKRFQQMNESKALKIRNLISKSPDSVANMIASEMEQFVSIVIPDPLSDVIGLLKDSVQQEVNRFLTSFHIQREGIFVSKNDYTKLPRNQTSTSLLLKLSKDLRTFHVLNKLEEKIRIYQVPEIDELRIIGDLKVNIEERKEFIRKKFEDDKELMTEVQKEMGRLKKALYFWRQEPLNEALTGLEIKGYDIQYWLSHYAQLKIRLKQEKLVRQMILLDSSQSSSREQSSF